MRLLLSALAMVCTASQALAATSLPPQKKLMELKQNQIKQKETKPTLPKQIQPKQILAKPAQKKVKKPLNKVRNQPLDSCSSSSSSSASSASVDDQAYVGAYTNNLSLDVEFNPADLASVLVDIPGSNPAAQAMIFDTNQTGSPVNITHPTVGPDFTRFRVDKNGTYLITWTFTIGCLYAQGEGCLNGAFVQLYDVAHEQPLFPNPMQFVDTENVDVFPSFFDSETVSGQQLIYLEAGAELQLRLIHAEYDFGTLWVANPSLTITRVAN